MALLAPALLHLTLAKLVLPHLGRLHLPPQHLLHCLHLLLPDLRLDSLPLGRLHLTLPYLPRLHLVLCPLRCRHLTLTQLLRLLTAGRFLQQHS